MKIKEAIEIINGSTITVLAEESNGFLHIYRRDFKVHANWFLEMPIDVTNWDYICNDWDCLSNIEPRDLARVMDVIQRLLNTPVEERFPEKKYRLVANPNSLEQTGTYATKYVACIQDGMDGFSFIYGEPTVFSEKELKQIEELHPNIAPAIDTMKEEVKDDEAD